MKDRKSSGGFEFRDRSGKVHRVSGGGKKNHEGPSVTRAKPSPHGERAARVVLPHEVDRGYRKDHGKSQHGKPQHAEPHAKPYGKPSPQGKPAHGKTRRGKSPFEKEMRGKAHGKFRERHERYEKPRHGKPHRGGKHPHRGGGGGGEMVTLKATVDKNRKGFGFLIFENRKYEDAFIPPREAQDLFHGDRVEVVLDGDGEVIRVRVLEHRFRELVGRYSPHPMGPSRGGWVVYERKRAREEIYVPKAPAKVAAQDWVRAKLEFHEDGPHRVTAEITEVYGSELPASADIGMVAAEYNLTEEHSQAAEQEARSMRLEVPGKDLEGRRDLRKVPFITIDGETARDFDDAVYVEHRKGGYVLWVAIADVSHYVTEGSALDKEARSRGTSVYFPERAFHMLPRALSETLCSLRPNEPRLTLVSRIEFDLHGKRQKTEMMEAVIESRRRATYEQIQSEWEANGKNPNWEFTHHFALYQALRKARNHRGSIDFDLPEAEVRVDPQGEVISIKNRPRLDSHRLIEEFMIAANEAVTDWMMKRRWPFVFRIHDEPSIQALDRFQQLAATVGVEVRLDKGKVSPKVMADVVRRVEGHPAQLLLNMALLRSMKQAVYSATHGIHYGLASEGYSHFTSPIRRYPDLVVHRLVRQVLRLNGKPLKTEERQELERELDDVCEHCSYRERVAADADREAIRLKQVRIMLRHLGEEFEGKVVGMMEAGFFVQLPDPYVEGMVSKESMTDDLYEYNEERMVFAGRRKKRTFKMGDPVRIKVVKADIDRRQVEFVLTAV